MTFHVGADPGNLTATQRVRHAYHLPQGLSIFSPVLDADRIRTPNVSLDLPAGSGGLRASHMAAIGSTVVLDLGEEGFRTAIARDGRILYGEDFTLSGERGYVVNFHAPLTFTLEGEPYGTPIISNAVAAAPRTASSDVWAFALAVRVAEPARAPQGLRARARNPRTGEERVSAVGPNGVAVLAFVDAGREPVVSLGDTLTVDVLAPDGWVVGSSSIRVDGSVLAAAHAVANIAASPPRTLVLPNYPNPFNPETWIPFELAHAGDVTLTLYDAAGRRVRSLELGRREAGYHGAGSGAARWDGRNLHGEPAASGAYVVELRFGDERSTRRILLAR